MWSNMDAPDSLYRHDGLLTLTDTPHTPCCLQAPDISCQHRCRLGIGRANATCCLASGSLAPASQASSINVVDHAPVRVMLTRVMDHRPVLTPLTLRAAGCVHMSGPDCALAPSTSPFHNPLPNTLPHPPSNTLLLLGQYPLSQRLPFPHPFS
jgi:hypothetical protein